MSRSTGNWLLRVFAVCGGSKVLCGDIKPSPVSCKRREAVAFVERGSALIDRVDDDNLDPNVHLRRRANAKCVRERESTDALSLVATVHCQPCDEDAWNWVSVIRECLITGGVVEFDAVRIQ